MVYLWRAVDTEGEVLDVLVQSKLDKHAALKLMRKLLKKYGFVLDRMITDDLRSYGVAARALGIDRRHERGQWRSNRNRSLDDAAVETPSIALGHAAREALRMVDVLDSMIEGVADAVRRQDREAISRTRRQDDVLDAFNREIKQYVTRLDPDSMTDDEHRRLEAILTFSLNLERAGE
jgi:transposase-like protein